ncbi:MAG TPA: hypothetical protein VNS88_06240 [Nitrospiraceae bacterium]|nr:hypothetical protein [Nitrospiraceae bacterium]
MMTVMIRIITDDDTARDIERSGSGRIEDAAAAGSCTVDDILLMEVVP